MPARFPFDELVRNALDFLGTAFTEFDTKPKYSVIHFCTAIELLLKARLMHEHWSLIVDGYPNIRKFEQGNFKSTGFKDLIPKIEDVLNEKIPDEMRKCFENISDHRNKMIHFFHEASSPAKKKLITEIAVEQCSGWFFLRRLLERWSKVFGPYEAEIALLNRSMKRHHIYLQTVYEKIKPEIDKRKKKGIVYRICPSCNFEASREKNLTKNVIECSCEVCLIKGHMLRIECPACEKKFDLGESDHSKCGHCNAELEKDELDGQINTDPTTTDNYSYQTPINCVACSGYHSVVAHHNLFVCLECRVVEKDMAVCGWCNDGQIGGGNLEDSFSDGCEFCDGHIGHVADRD